MLTLFVGETGVAITALTVVLNKDKKQDQFVHMDTGNPEERFTGIVLSQKHLIALIGTGPKKMTEAENLIYTYFLAVTLLHELAHAYGQIYLGNMRAIYFDDPDTQESDLMQRPEVC